jgi:hypothetical protein
MNKQATMEDAFHALVLSKLAGAPEVIPEEDAGSIIPEALKGETAQYAGAGAAGAGAGAAMGAGIGGILDGAEGAGKGAGIGGIVGAPTGLVAMYLYKALQDRKGKEVQASDSDSTNSFLNGYMIGYDEGAIPKEAEGGVGGALAAANAQVAPGQLAGAGALMKNMPKPGLAQAAAPSLTGVMPPAGGGGGGTDLIRTMADYNKRLRNQPGTKQVAQGSSWLLDRLADGGDLMRGKKPGGQGTEQLIQNQLDGALSR